MKTDSTFWCWGLNNYGQLGIPNSGSNSINLITYFGNSTVWREIVAGDFYTMGIKQNGTLWAWGNNEDYRLGDGTNTNRLTPVQIGNGQNWKHVFSGSYNTFATKQDGTLWAWGSAIYGGLGTGSIVDQSTPVQVGIDNDWLSVSSGYRYSLGLKQNGVLVGWGYCNSNQLGDGDFNNRYTPVLLRAGNTYKQAQAAYTHAQCIKTDNTREVWGYNYSGLPGTGVSSTTPLNPTTITIPTTTWKDVSGNRLFSAAISQTGTLYTWGDNDYGNLGQGNAPTTITPTQVGATNEWLTIKTGNQSFVIGIKNDGTLWSWGNGANGQLGTGFYNTLTIPTQIGMCSSSTSILEVNTNNTITISPNPAGNNLQVTSSETINTIEIISLTGKVIQQENNINATNTIINISALNSGIYFAKIITQNNKFKTIRFEKF
jgi:alpha-tubulin suppressor-like RCC1 family protein